MSAIEGSTVSCRTLADGTLRVAVDIEPAMAQAAFTLFGAPGRGVALAALRDGRGQIEEKTALEPFLTAPVPDPSTPAEKPRQHSAAQAERWESLGTLTKAAITIGAAPEFWAWAGVTNSHDAGALIKSVCKVASRKELDTDDRAAAIFKVKVLEPYRMHLNKNQRGRPRAT
jgi:hypothetical protein